MVALLAHSLPDPSGAPLPMPALTMIAVDPAQFVGELGEHLRHLLVVVDVQGGDRHRDAGVTLEQLGFELVEPVGAAGAQRQVAALRGECAGHARAQARADAPVIRIFCRVIGTA